MNEVKIDVCFHAFEDGMGGKVVKLIPSDVRDFEGCGKDERDDFAWNE